VHSGTHGVFDGVLHYRLAVMNGGPWDTASLRIALRGEYFDPSLDRSGDEAGTVLAGVDLEATHGVRAGVFGGATIVHDAMQNRDGAAAEITLRAQYGF
jgi:hypothetical protein